MADTNSTEYTRFKENIGYTVIMPGEDSSATGIRASVEQCKAVAGISGILAALLVVSTVIVSMNFFFT